MFVLLIYILGSITKAKKQTGQQQVKGLSWPPYLVLILVPYSTIVLPRIMIPIVLLYQAIALLQNPHQNILVHLINDWSEKIPSILSTLPWVSKCLKHYFNNISFISTSRYLPFCDTEKNYITQPP